MAVDLDQLTRLCVALDVADDEARVDTAWLELVCSDLPSAEKASELAAVEATIRAHPLVVSARAELDDVVRRDPQLALDLVVAEVHRVETGGARFVTDYGGVLFALADIDAVWLHTVVGLVETESMWSSLQAAFRRPLGRLILDQFGLEGLADAWLRHASAPRRDTSMWWAWQIVNSVEQWADESMHRRLLVTLVDLADDDTILDVAAGPLEDFCDDRDGRLDWIGQQARINPRFLEALSGVWTHGKDEITNARIRAIAPRQ